MQITPLPGLGASITDIALAEPLQADDITCLQDAYASYHLLAFHEQELTPARQVEICAMFGPIQPSGGSQYGYVSNVRPDGVVPSGPLLFHSDLSFTEWPLLGISLFAVDVPDSGSQTLFASTTSALDRLSSEVRQALVDKHVLNTSNFRLGDTKRQQEHEVDPCEHRHIHPALGTHPRSGELFLLISEAASVRIIELERNASDDLLDAVFAGLYDDVNVYRHQWRPGDFLLWDNFAVQHGRRSFDPAEPRTLQRVVLGEGPEYNMSPAQHSIRYSGLQRT